MTDELLCRYHGSLLLVCNGKSRLEAQLMQVLLHKVTPFSYDSPCQHMEMLYERDEICQIAMLGSM